MEPPYGGIVGGHSDRLGDQTARWKSGTDAAVVACGSRSPGATRPAMRKYRGSHGEMHPAGTDTPRGRKAAGAHREGCGRSMDGRTGIQTRQAGSFARPSDDSRGTTGQEKSLIEAGTVVASEVVAAAWEASLATWCRDTAAKTPSTPNKRPLAHVARHAGVAASDGTATASLGLYAAMRVRIVLIEGRRIAQQN